MDHIYEIFAAIEDGEIELAKSLLEEDPTLANATTPNGQTVFWWAASFGRTELIEQMLREPIREILDYRKSDDLLRSPLDAARAYNQREVLALLNPLYGVGVETEYLEEGQEEDDELEGPSPPDVEPGL